MEIITVTKREQFDNGKMLLTQVLYPDGRDYAVEVTRESADDMIWSAEERGYRLCAEDHQDRMVLFFAEQEG